jgi:putative ABC transport system permease protein
VITGGFRTMAGQLSQAGGADFIVGQTGSADFTFSIVNEEEIATLQARPDVEGAIGLLLTIRRVESNPFFVTLGVDPGDLEQVDLQVLDGRLLDPSAQNEAMLGDAAARDLGLGVGDTITLDDRDFVVVGVVRSGIAWQDKGAIVRLDVLQEMTGRTGVVTFVMVRVEPGENISKVAADIEAMQPAVVTVRDASEFGELDQGLDLMNAANVAISVLAVGIGAIGVMNTMGMAVFERTREIGVLHAIGWSGKRILRMILTESLFLCAVAAVIGTLLGILASETVVRLSAVSGLILPEYEPRTFVQAILIAVLVALAGAAYPSYRAVRLTPLEALRHE